MQRLNRLGFIGGVMLALVVMVLPPTGRVAAQDDWFVYLFDNNSQQLMRLYADSRQEFFDLKINDNTFVSGWELAFSTDNRVAYCAIDFSPQGENVVQFPATLIIRELGGGQILSQMPLGDVVGCRVSSFSADNQLMAVGIARYYPGDPAVTTDQPAWELLLVDGSGTTMYRTEPSMLPALDVFAYLMDVRYFENDQVVFAAIPYAVGGAPEYPAYNWRYVENTFSEVPAWGKTSVDSSGGELIWTDFDPSLPYVEPGGPSFPINVLMLADKSGGDKVIYHTPDWIIGTALFVNEGRQIAMFQYPPFDETAPPEVIQPNRWVIIGRDGALTEIQMQGFGEMLPAPSGFVMMTVVYSVDGTTNTTYNLDWYQNGTPSRLWSNDPTQPSSWQLVWTSPLPRAEGLAEFPALSQ